MKNNVILKLADTAPVFNDPAKTAPVFNDPAKTAPAFNDPAEETSNTVTLPVTKITPTNHSATHQSSYGGRLQSVLEMQKAIQVFSKTMQDEKNQDTIDYFIANYASIAHKFSDQLGHIDTSVNKEKTDEEVILKQTITSLSQTGTQKMFTSLDGIWGPRTQAAVKNVAVFADTMLSFGDVIKFTSEEFKVADKAALDAAIPQDERVSAKEKDTDAKIITPLVNKLSNYTRYLFKYINEALSGDNRKISTKSTAEQPDDVKDLIAQYGYVPLALNNLIIPTGPNTNYTLSTFAFTLNDLSDANTIADKIMTAFKQQTPGLDERLLFPKILESMPNILDQLYDATYDSILNKGQP